MTEKNYNPQQKEKKAMKKQPKKSEQTVETPVKKPEEKQETKTEEKKIEAEEKKKQPVKKIKKEEVSVNVKDVRMSTKYAVNICRFIKRKRIGDAIRELEMVVKKKKSVPMKGEYAHKKGPGKVASGSGKFPINASKQFIVLLKSLAGNANNHEMEEPVIIEAIANLGSRPLGRFGTLKRKRTHIILKAKEKKTKPIKEKK